MTTTPESTPSQPKPAKKPGRWRRRSIRILVIVVILTLAARIFVPLLLPTVLRKAAGLYGMNCYYDRLELNLLSGDAGIWGLEFRPKEGGDPILTADYCHGNIAVLKLLRGRLDVWRIEADTVEINIDRTADGRIPLLDRFINGRSAAPAPAPPSSTVRSIDLTSPLRVDALRLNHIRVHLHDQSVKPTLDTTLAMDIRLSDLGSPDRPAKFEFDLSNDAMLDSLVVIGEGHSGGQVLEANMRVVAKGVRFKPVAAYLQPLGIHPVADGLTFVANGQVRTAPPPGNGEGLSGSIVLDHISAVADAEEAIALDKFELDADVIDTKSIHLARLLLDGVRAHGERAGNGKLRLAGLEWDPSTIAHSPTPPSVSPTNQPSILADILAEPWSLAELTVRNLNATFHDNAVTPAADLSLVSDELSIKNINHDPNNLNTTVTFAGLLHSPKLIHEINLTASAQPFASKKTFQLAVDASGIKPDALKPYLDQLGLESQLAAGQFTSTVAGWLAITDNGELNGELNVDKVSLRDGHDLLTFNGIHATGLSLNPATGQIRANDIELSGPGISAHRDATGTLACLGLHTKPAVSSLHSTDATASSSPSHTTIELPRIDIGRFAWKEIHFALTDETVSPATKISVSDAGVEITHFSTAATQPAQQGHLHAWLAAPGIAEDLSVEGDILPAADPRAAGVSLDVKVDGKAITASAIAPYLSSLGIEPTLTDGNLQLHAKAGVAQSGNGITASLAADHVRFADGSTELAAVDQFSVDGIAVNSGEFSVDSVDIVRPRSAVARDADNSFLAAGVRLRLPQATANSPHPTTAPSVKQIPLLQLPFAAVLKKLRVHDASLALTDRAVRPTVRTIARADVDLDNLTLGRPAPPATLKLTAKATDVADELTVIGTLTTAPDHQAANLEIAGRGLKAGPLAAYMPSGMDVALTDGRFHTKINVDLSGNPKGGYQANLFVDGVDYRDGADGPALFSLNSVKIAAPRIDLPYNALAIDELLVTGVETSAQLTPDGTVKLLGLVLGGPSKEVATPTAPAEAASVTVTTGPVASAADLVAAAHRALPLVTVNKLDLGVRRLSLVDASRPAAAPLVVSDLHLKNIERIEWLGKDAEYKPPTKLQLTCRIDPLVDQLTVDALVSPFARQPGIQLDVAGTGVHGNGLTALAPELKPHIDGSQLTDGNFSAHLESLAKLDRETPIDFDPSHGMDLDFLVKDVQYRATPNGPVLAGLEELQSEGIRIEPASSLVHIKTLEITKPIGFFTMDNAGIHVLGWVVEVPTALTQQPKTAMQSSTITLADVVPADIAADEKPKGEFRIDKLLIIGLDGRFEDHACNPPLIVPLDGLDVEVRDISTLALSEDRPIHFNAIVNAAKVRLPKQAQETSTNKERQWEDRDLFAQITANGKISFYPKPNGWIKTSVSGFELSSLEGVAKQFRVSLSQGTFDSETDARLNPDGSIEINSHFRTTDLSLSEPSDGPISHALGITVPLDVAIPAVQEADGGISIPVNMTIQSDQLTMEDILSAFPPAIGSVIGAAVLSAPIRVGDAGLSVFGVGPGKKAAEQPIVIAFAPGAIALDETQRQSLNVLINRLRLNSELTLTIHHELSSGDVQLAMQRANPSPTDCRDMEHQLLSHKTELLRLRADAAGQARAQLMSLGESNAAAALARLTAIDQELARTEDALDQVLELLRPGADRQASRRMRAVALDFGQERLDAVQAALLASKLSHIADRIKLIDPQFNPTDSNSGGRLLIAVIVNKDFPYRLLFYSTRRLFTAGLWSRFYRDQMPSSIPPLPVYRLPNPSDKRRHRSSR